MFESPKLPGEIGEQQVIEASDAKGIEDPEVKELLGKYIDQCHAEADAEAAADPENPDASNRANLKADIKIARLYSQTKAHKDYARELLEDTYIAASQSDSTQDLAEQIDDLIRSLA